MGNVYVQNEREKNVVSSFLVEWVTMLKEWMLLKVLSIQGFSFLSFGFFLFSDMFTEAGITPKLNTKRVLWQIEKEINLKRI